MKLRWIAGALAMVTVIALAVPAGAQGLNDGRRRLLLEQRCQPVALEQLRSWARGPSGRISAGSARSGPGPDPAARRAAPSAPKAAP